MRKLILAIALAATLPLGACASDSHDGRRGYKHPGYGNDHSRHDDRRRAYHRRQLHDNDRIYRDRHGRYYCKRDDGTEGTIVGALAGGVLGNVIAPGGSKTLGSILGAGAGALAGRAIDRGDIQCE